MKRVLIADDEPIERMIVSRTIEKYFSEELTVVSAANGREAVEQFFAGDCQIALLDIEMPGMNGLEAAEQIRKRDKNCSIIFYHILISHNSCFRKFYSHSLSVCIIHIYMVIIDECHKFCTLSVCFYRPRFVAIVEYEFKSFVRSFIGNGVSVFVCFY